MEIVQRCRTLEGNLVAKSYEFVCTSDIDTTYDVDTMRKLLKLIQVYMNGGNKNRMACIYNS